MRQFGFIALLCLVFSLGARAQEKFSKVQIPVSSADEKRKVVRLLELDHYELKSEAITCEIAASDLQLLQAAGISYQVLVADIAADLKERNSRMEADAHQSSAAGTNFETACKLASEIIKAPAAFTTTGAMGGYYSLSEMNAAMDALVAAYPTIVSKFSIGKTYENRDIYGVKISDNVSLDENEPEVLYSALQHAREAITGTSLIFFMQYLAENYASDYRVQSLVKNREIFIIPCMNPDGYEYNRTSNPTGGGLWRKNRRRNSDGTYGVDLNRNYSYDWGVNGGGSSVMGDETYWGTSAFSEPETQAMRSFVTARKFVVAIDQHCYGSYYSLPFGIVNSSNVLTTEETNFYTYIPALMGKYNCHRAGNSIQTVGYDVAGGIKDWLFRGDVGTGTKGRVLGMTGEANGTSFWAARADIIPYCQVLCLQNLQLAYSAGPYFEVQDASDIAVTSTSATFNFTVRRVGIENSPVTVTLTPVENVLTAGSAVSTSIATYHGTYNGAISYTVNPGLVAGSRIRFQLKIEAGGIISYKDITKFYNPLSLFTDDMETGIVTGNWDVSPTLPRGGQTIRTWYYVNNYAQAGSYSMTESPEGDYAASSTRTATYKNTLNLSDASAAYLSFWVRNRAENCSDKMRVEVSTNGGTSYVPVCGENTISESAAGGQYALTGIRENWTREIVDLSAYKSSALKFRFAFYSNTDDASDDFYKKVDDGFYIDNVKVIKSLADMTPLPVTFVTFSGKLLSNNTVQLYWEAFTDEQHDYFVVEKSADGIHYHDLGKAPKYPPFQFADASPYLGKNYYRIRQLDKDGKTSYSNTITVVRRADVNLTLFPNPVKDFALVRVASSRMEPVRIQVADLQGRVVYQGVQRTGSTESEWKIDMRSWAPQLYSLRVYNSRNELLATEKLVKL